MQFEIFTDSPAQTQADCLVIGVHESGTVSAAGIAVDRQSGGKLSKFLKSGDFPGRLGETLLLPAFPRMKASRLLLVGQGKTDVTRKAWRKALQAAVSALARTKCKSAAVALSRPASRELDDYLFARSAAEITHAALYRVNDLKSGKRPAAPELARIKFGPVRASSAASARREIGRAHV